MHLFHWFIDGYQGFADAAAEFALLEGVNRAHSGWRASTAEWLDVRLELHLLD